ncbi:MAG: hypothetical protein ACLU30_15940 [Odoribacter splanchnicus]
MRNLLLLLMMISGLWCCQKEDSITPELKLEDLYAVKTMLRTRYSNVCMIFTITIK